MFIFLLKALQPVLFLKTNNPIRSLKCCVHGEISNPSKPRDLQIVPVCTCVPNSGRLSRSGTQTASIQSPCSLGSGCASTGLSGRGGHV